jgi:hypothetical protein
MARVAAVDNRLRPISTGVKIRALVRVVGKPEVIQLDEKTYEFGSQAPVGTFFTED